MRVAHLSDTHLGFAQYAYEDPETGANAREMDAYRAFEDACRRIRQEKPDLLLHSGDLFDHPRPPNRAIIVALREFAHIAQSEIPIVLIAGNHSLPSLRGSACILEIFESLVLVHPVWRHPGRVVLDGVAVACVPHAPDERALCRAVEEAQPDPGAHTNLLLVHAGLSDNPSTEGTEARVPRALVQAKAAQFDYVALGHYHRPTRVAPNAWYAGATEHFHEADAGPCGFVIADIARRDVKHIPIRTRAVVIQPAIDCAGLAATEIVERAVEVARSGPPGAVMRLTLERIARGQEPDEREIRARLPHLLHVDFRKRHRAGRRPTPPWSSEPLLVQFERFIREHIPDERARTPLLDLARRTFARAQEEEPP